MTAKKQKSNKTSSLHGAENLKKWREQDPRGERPALKHGSYSAHIRERYSDLRSVEGRRLKAVIDALTQDLGGDLTASQELVLSFLRSQLIVIWQISDYTDRQSSILDKTGSLLPCLKQSLLAYEESASRNLERLYGFSRRKKGKIPSIQDIINQSE